MNRRLLSLLVALSVVTTATFSGGLPTFAGNEDMPIPEVVETVEDSIMDSVYALLEKADATASDAEGEETPDVIKIDAEKQDSKPTDIELTATAEDGTVVVLNAEKEAFPYENLALEVHVVTGDEAEAASDEIDAEKPAENSAKRVTYDVQVQSNGTEVQPADGKKVSVSFKVAEAPSGADEVTVYHHDEQDGELEEIATAEVTDSATTVDSAVVVDSAETNVVISESENTNASSDEEYYEDYELENDLIVTGETDSFSFYTVDFTYDQKTVSIAGDTDHNELSSVLEQAGITDAITEAIACMDKDCTQPAANNTVTVDGTDLFRVYEENGTWYVDAINAFSSTHGLLIKAADAEYKIEVTDDSLQYVAKAVPGVTLTVNDAVVNDYFERYGTDITCHYTSGDHYRIDWWSGISLHWDYLRGTKVERGYDFKNEWIFEKDNSGGKYNGKNICYPKVYQIMVSVTVDAGVGGTVDNGGSIKARDYAPIEKTGAQLSLGGYNNVITAMPNPGYIFDCWETNPAGATNVSSGLKITAKFVKDPATTKKISTKTVNEMWGTVDPVFNGVLVQNNSTIYGNISGDLTHSDTLKIDGETFKATAKEGCVFIGWKAESKSGKALEEGKITEDTVFVADFVNTTTKKTVKILTPTGGSYNTVGFEGDSVDVPENSTLTVIDDTVYLTNGTLQIEARPYSNREFVAWVTVDTTQDTKISLLEGTTKVLNNMSIRPVFRLAGERMITVDAVSGGHLQYGGESYDTVQITASPSTPMTFATTSNTLKVTYINKTGTSTTETITAVPDTGYNQVTWVDVPESSVDDVDIKVEFSADMVSMNVNASPIEGGTVMNGGAVTAKKNTDIVQNGNELQLDGYNNTIQAIPNTGYEFKRWDIPGVALVSEGKTIEAVFERVTSSWAKISAVSNNVVRGTVTPAISEVNVLKEKEIAGVDRPEDIIHSIELRIGDISFKASPSDGCYFTGWTSNPASALTDKKITKDTTFTANFVNGNNPKTVTLAKTIGGTYETIGFTGDSVKVPEDATIAVSGATISMADGSIQIKAKPDANYKFVNWLDGNGNLLTGSSNKVTADMKIQAVFQMSTSQSVTITAEAGGNLVYRGETKKTVMFAMSSLKGTKVTVDSSNPDRLLIVYLNSDGEKVTESIDAVPEIGYKANTDDGIWTGVPSGISFDKADIKAHFKVSTATVSFIKDGEGDICWNGTSMLGNPQAIQTGKQVVKYGSHLLIGDKMLLEATTSDADYIFDKWVVSPDTGRIDKDTTIQAVFTKVGAAKIVVVTTAVNNDSYGTVYPINPVKVKSGETIKGSTQSTAIYIGTEKFTAVSKEGLSFDRWEISGAEWDEEIKTPITLTAFFVDYSGKGGRNITFATPTNGTYQNSFQGDTLVVPEKGASFKVDGDTITFGNGKAYAKALPDYNYKFSGWYSTTLNQMIPDKTSITDIKNDGEVVATFTYIRPCVDDVETKSYPSSGSGGGGGSTLPGDPNSKNYHAENTYGSMDAPISDGLWEHLADDTWKYNWRIPMVSAWGCIVNPYANPGTGQQPHGWFFFDPYGIMLTGWRLVDGKWYYLEPISNGCRGQLYTNTTTPDGYKVDANGAWIK